ncbi:MAG TPA: tetratricopeptide repeat protein [Dongiaceae bacterium]|nr:tetratricopeptide repeat protein [Dongiaceae bacterium]
MFRLIAVLVFFLFFSLPSVSQSLADHRSAPGPRRDQPTTRDAAEDRRALSEDNRISIVRLKVPRKARALYQKALDAFTKSSHAETQRNLDEALKIDPEFPEALTLYGGMQAAEQQWGAAEQRLQAAIDIDPTYPPAYIVLAGVYNSQSRFDDAQRATEQALSAGANTWDVQYEIVRTFMGKGQYENALATCEQALRGKHGTLLHLARGHALLGLGRYPEAATEFKTYLHDDPAGEGSADARDLLQKLDIVVAR